MSQIRLIQSREWLLLVLACWSGCSSILSLPGYPHNSKAAYHLREEPGNRTAEHMASIDHDLRTDAIPDIIPHSMEARPELSSEQCFEGDDCWDGWGDLNQLTLESLISAVFQVNSSIDVALSAWQAAAHRYPQVISFDDPQFRYLSGVQFFDGLLENGNRTTSFESFRQRYQFQQLIPWYGKRRLRGEIAIAEAEATSHEIIMAELRLLEATKEAYFGYLTSYRKSELHRQDVEVAQTIREAARQKVEAGRMPPHELQKAEMDCLKLKWREEELLRAERVARARINTLLHRKPDSHLPPPRELAVVSNLPPASMLRDLAEGRRPDVAAFSAQIDAAESAVDLAKREFFPDFYFVGRFDSIDQRSGEANLRPQLGFNVYLPVRLSKRKAAVKEAEANLRRSRAELRHLGSEIDFEVLAAYEAVQESLNVLELYPELFELLEQNVSHLEQAARENPAMWKQWLGARRELIEHEMQVAEARLEYYRRLASLERIVGMPLLEVVDLEQWLPPQ